MNLLQLLSRILAATFLAAVSLNAADAHSEMIRKMLTTLNENGQFNGSILVASNGLVIYRDAFGTAANSSKRNQPETPSNLASVTKQFTAMAVMMLVERGKIHYDDLVAKHLPQLGDSSAGITVRHLLTHTSGIPDVGDLGIDHPNLKESEVLKAIVEQHAGNADQYRAFIGRRIGERILVVILTNQGPSRRPEICEAIVNILHGKPYTMPKLSITMKIAVVIQARGVEAGIKEYERLKATQPESFNFSDESELNLLGYQLLGRGEKQAAIRIFELNTRQFPASANAYDSLGEAYTKAGQNDRAIQAYSKALELDPKNLNSQKMLRSLK